MRCALIEAEKAIYPIAWMCRQLNVPRSSFYAWRAAADTVTATAGRRRLLAELVAKVFDDSRGTYGCRRVAAELNRRGHPASVGLVADLLRELGLVACQSRAYKTTTIRQSEVSTLKGDGRLGDRRLRMNLRCSGDDWVQLLDDDRVCRSSLCVVLMDCGSSAGSARCWSGLSRCLRWPGCTAARIRPAPSACTGPGCSRPSVPTDQ
jgi:hypothetical protein